MSVNRIGQSHAWWNLQERASGRTTTHDISSRCHIYQIWWVLCTCVAYMRAFEVDLASQTCLPATRHMVTQTHVYAITGWAWHSSCGVGFAIGALVSFLSIPCPFVRYHSPSHLSDLLPRAWVRFVIGSAPIIYCRSTSAWLRLKWCRYMHTCHTGSAFKGVNGSVDITLFSICIVSLLLVRLYLLWGVCI